VPNFKQNDLLIHALVLHFAHSSMPESVHPAVWDSKLLADRTKHIPVDITDLQWIAELCHDGNVVQLVRQAVKDLKRGPGSCHRLVIASTGAMLIVGTKRHFAYSP